jgi:hypothetical protein
LIVAVDCVLWIVAVDCVLWVVISL